MTKNNFYKYLAMALLVVNISLLLFFVIKKSNSQHPGDRPRDIIIERLGFDKVQQDSYQRLIAVHRQTIKNNVDQIHELKKILYSTLNEKQSNSAVTDSLISDIANLQNNIEQIHYAHFLDIKKMCTPIQLPKFINLTKDLATIFSPIKGPMPRK